MLLTELRGLDERGVDTSRLLISADAHLLMPYHVAIDKVTERYMGSKKIGTTGRGIGPCYQDKIARIGIRVADVLDEDSLAAKGGRRAGVQNQVLVKIYNRKALDPHEVVETLLAQAEGFRHRIADTRLLLNSALEAGETVLLEGSQGTLLDVDHGTYPYVTSSNPTAGGAAVGSGIGPTRITTVLGILKAYTTRVGSGPFPTELFDESGEYLAKTGGEVGVTTGRRRRCGWFDAVIARYATRVNRITDYFLTKLDVLSSLETVPVCVGYTVDGRRTNEMPMTQSDIARAEPIYEELPGWWEDISGAGTSTTCPSRPATTSCGWKSLPERTFRASGWARVAIRPSCAATCWRRGYERSTPGGPGVRPARRLSEVRTRRPRTGIRPVHRGHAPPAGPRGLGRPRPGHLGGRRRPRRRTRGPARPVRGGRGVGPANRVPSLPGAGSLLMAPYRVSKFQSDSVEFTVQFSRYHVGGNNAVHGGVLPLMFDSIRHGHPRRGPADQPDGIPACRLPQRHADRRAAHGARLAGSGRGRKAFVKAEMTDPDGKLLAEAHGLMVRLLPGQP